MSPKKQPKTTHSKVEIEHKHGWWVVRYDKKSLAFEDELLAIGHAILIEAQIDK